MQTFARIPIAQPLIGEEERQAVLAVLDSGQLAQGSVVSQLEASFADWCGVKHCVAASSGTAALHLAMLAHGVEAGDEVITTPFSFVASANAAFFVGARPVFVDVELDTYCLDPALVEAAVTPRTRAILPVHLYGHPAQMEPLTEIAREHGLLLVEDACQAHGGAIGGRKVGTWGDSAVFSLYPTKNMTSGEGGFLTTNDDELDRRARVIRNHGASEPYRHEVLGYNFRLTDVHAAIGLAQLRKLHHFNDTRRRNAAALNKGLGTLTALVVPTERPGYTHTYHQYTIRVRGGRGKLQQALAAKGIESSIHYPLPIHRQPFYLGLGYGDVHLPKAERLAADVLSLPVHPGLRPTDVETIIEAIWELLPSP